MLWAFADIGIFGRAVRLKPLSWFHKAQLHQLRGGPIEGLGFEPSTIGGVAVVLHLFIGPKGCHANGDVVVPWTGYGVVFWVVKAIVPCDREIGVSFEQHVAV